MGSYAALIDSRERFVISFGRVVEAGDLLKIKDGFVLKCFRKDRLLDAVAEAKLTLVFLPPAVRLPKAPNQLRDFLYQRIASAKSDDVSIRRPVVERGVR